MGPTGNFFLILVTLSVLDILMKRAIKVKDGLFAGTLAAYATLTPSGTVLIFVVGFAGALALAVIFPVLFHVVGKYTDFFETVLIGSRGRKEKAVD